MFTGLIEEIGIVKTITSFDKGAVIRIMCFKVKSDLKIGDSIAINGACQTVTKIYDDGFEVEAAYETLKLTNLKVFSNGTRVNLERALTLQSRLGGHLVSGHVDAEGEFLKKISEGIAEIFYFKIPETVEKYVVLKGSITVNGVSLTITSVEHNVITISVIPETVRATTFQFLKPGDKINLESDIIAKYIEKFMQSPAKNKETITMSYLAEHGFL